MRTLADRAPGSDTRKLAAVSNLLYAAVGMDNLLKTVNEEEDMATYFVSRHPGARDWAQRQGIEAEMVEHLDVNRIEPGDRVIGTLPIHLAAEVTNRGARYFHLEVDLPSASRGRDLSADEMERFGAKLTEFFVKRLSGTPLA